MNHGPAKNYPTTDCGLARLDRSVLPMKPSKEWNPPITPARVYGIDGLPENIQKVPEAMQITKDGEYTTRDGKPVRIYAVDGGGYANCRIHGAVLQSNGWELCTWGADGRYLTSVDDRRDLIPKPKVHKLDVWINVYLDENGKVQISPGWSNKADADGYLRRIACIHIQRDITEGEGL